MRGAQQGISLVCWQILFLNPSVRVLNPHLVSVWETPASLPPFRLHSPRRPVKIFHVWCGLRATNHQGGSVWNLCAFLGSFGSGRVIVRVRGRVCSSGYVCDLAHSHALIWHWCTHSIGGGGGVGGYAFKRNAQKWDEPPGHRGEPTWLSGSEKTKNLGQPSEATTTQPGGRAISFSQFPIHFSSVLTFIFLGSILRSSGFGAPRSCVNISTKLFYAWLERETEQEITYDILPFSCLRFYWFLISGSVILWVTKWCENGSRF